MLDRVTILDLDLIAQARLESCIFTCQVPRKTRKPNAVISLALSSFSCQIAAGNFGSSDTSVLQRNNPGVGGPQYCQVVHRKWVCQNP